MSDARSRLFKAKLRPPIDPSTMLARAASGSAQALASARLVLVNGPAGFGKTTTLTQYERSLRDRSVATAWVTFDADDNDPARFTGYLRAALASVVPAAAAVAPRATGATGDRGAVLAEAYELIDALAGHSEALAIFFDDFEKLVDAEVLGLVTRLLATLGPRQQLVIGSRAVPELGIARLRANAQLVEIGPERLRFTPDETRRFLLEVHGCAMNDEDIAFLHERSEGWPAALQLAALAYHEHPERARGLREFGGSAAEVADYLAAEVLTQLPADLRGFLLRTSILETFCAELCEAVTGEHGAAAMIGRVGRANLFLVPLDAERRWFRYHAICAEFLRSHLERAQPREMPELHRRAARWLAAQGRHAAAIEHARRSGDVTLAAAIMDQCAASYLHEGQVATLVRWAEALPDEAIAAHPGLHFIVALALVVMHRYDPARRLIEAMDAVPGPRPEGRRRDLAMLRFNLVIWSDRLQGLREALNQALEAIEPGDGFIYPSMLNCVGYLAMLETNAEGARSALAAARASPHHRDNEVVRTYSAGQSAMIHLVRAELRDARDVAGAELERLAAAGMRYGTPGAIVALPLAEALYEGSDIAAARVLLDEHLTLAEDSCIPDLIAAGFLTRSRIARIEGRGPLADEFVGRLQRIGEQRALPRLVASALFEKSRVALAEGRIETATAQVAEAAAFAFWSMPIFRGSYANDLENPETGLARLELFRGATGAIGPLEERIRDAQSRTRVRRALKLRGLLAQALWLSGQRRPAMRELQKALAEAEPEGLVRVLADEPWVLQDMLASEPGTFARRVAEACGPSLATRATRAEPAGAILSVREIEVLAMLARGLANKQIARALSRSEATVATHLRRIYGKLGAHTRTQAIAIARRGGLVD